MLSISGLHLSLVAGILFVVVRFVLVLIPTFALRFPIKKWAAAAALLGSFVYLALAGFPVAANRSFLMVALVLGAVMLDRQVLSLRSVALAAILILLWTPESLLGPSFQLSFAATTAIVALYEVYRRTPLSQQFHDWWLVRPFFYLSGIAITSLVATAATAPFVILHFHQFALYPILANLLTSPILSVIVVPAGLLAVFLMPLGLEAFALTAMQWGITQINALAAWVSLLPHAVSYAPPFPTWGIACFTAGALWLCCWRQKWRLVGVPLMVVGLVSLTTTRLPDVVIAPLGEQVAVRNGEGGYAMVKGGDRNFIASIWAESLGIAEFTPAKDFKAMRCDSEGCVVKIDNHTLALPKLRQAAAEDCATTDAMVTSFYAACPRSEFIFSRPQEAAAIWWDEMRVERARSYVGRLLSR
jgi:competence protein ComEC